MNIQEQVKVVEAEKAKLNKLKAAYLEERDKVFFEEAQQFAGRVYKRHRDDIKCLMYIIIPKEIKIDSERYDDGVSYLHYKEATIWENSSDWDYTLTLEEEIMSFETFKEDMVLYEEASFEEVQEAVNKTAKEFLN